MTVADGVIPCLDYRVVVSDLVPFGCGPLTCSEGGTALVVCLGPW
jgi:hypothetical protein